MQGRSAASTIQGPFRLLIKTATIMESSPRLPPEISDRIIDLLRDETNALKRCCLVSKSWVSRTRKHLFDSVEFESSKDVKVWKETFPDPANSPARHTRSLSLVWVEAVIPMDPEEGSWIRAFSNVVQLTVWNGARNTRPLKNFLLTRTCLHRVHSNSALKIFDTYLFSASS